MPIRRLPQFDAWSWSRLGDWEECPLKAKLKHLDKIKEPGSPALDRGSAIHKEAEGYVTGRLPDLPASLERFFEEFAALRARKDAECERQLAVDAGWAPCDWFGPGAWLRVVIDCTHAGASPDEAGRTVIDYKTGKVRPRNDDQLDLYNLVALAYHPHVKRADAWLWYLDQGETSTRSLVRAEAAKLQRKWEKRVKPMLADRTFAPKPADECRWCFYGQAGVAKGGPGLCKY